MLFLMSGDTTRRSVLESTLGLGALGMTGAQIAVDTVSAADELVSARGPFVELTIEAKTETEAPKSVGCVSWPLFQVAFTDQPSSPPLVCISELGPQQLRLETGKRVVATHEELQTVDRQSNLSFGALPAQASAAGATSFLEGTDAPEVTLDVSEAVASAGVLDAQATVPRGSRDTVHSESRWTLDVGSEQATSISLSVVHHGLTRIVGHPEMVIVPKSSGWEQFVEAVEDGDTRPTQSEMTITDFEDEEVYGIERNSRGGAN